MKLSHVYRTNRSGVYALLSVISYHYNRRITSIVWPIMILLMFTSLAACGSRESSTAPQVTSATPVVHVTAEQIAQAMQDDRFFADYGNTTLVVQGIVSSVTQQNGDVIIRLKTSGPMKVLCHLGNHLPKLTVGDTITVQSADPQRNGSAVGLWNCSVS